MTPDILCERDGDIANVTLFNPEKLNALNAAMWSRLREVMIELDADMSLRCIVLRGDGASFAFLDTQDYAEGLAAFLEKRPPQFNGR